MDMKKSGFSIMIILLTIALIVTSSGCSIFKNGKKDGKSKVSTSRSKTSDETSNNVDDKMELAKGDTNLLKEAPPRSSEKVLSSKSSIYYEPNIKDSKRAECDFLADDEEIPVDAHGTTAMAVTHNSAVTPSESAVTPESRPTINATQISARTPESPQPIATDQPSADICEVESVKNETTSTAMPIPDDNGDYRVLHHRYWEVIDDDPAGLNGRLALNFPPAWFPPGNKVLKESINNWPVIRRFRKGTILVSNAAPEGTEIFCEGEENGKSWLKVNLAPKNTGSHGQEILCFVRANNRYIRPIAPTRDYSDLSFNLAVIDDPDGYTNIRSGPGKNHKLCTKVNENKRFIVLSKRGEWRKVFVMQGNGKKGFIHESRIKIDRNDAIGAATVKTDTSIYGAPSNSSGTVGMIHKDNIVCVLATDINDFTPDSGSWIKIITQNGTTGYVNTSEKPLSWIPL